MLALRLRTSATRSVSSLMSFGLLICFTWIFHRSINWENRHIEGIDRKTHETQTRSLPAFLPAVTLSLAVLSILLSIFLAPRRYSQLSSQFFLAPRRYSQAVLAIFLAPRRYSQAVLAIFLAPSAVISILLLYFSILCKRTLSHRVPGLKTEDLPKAFKESSTLSVFS